MTGPSPTSANPSGAWRAASERLRSRATRRARLGAILRGAAAGVAGGAVAAAALRLLSAGPRGAGLTVLAASTAVGLLVGARAALRARPPSIESAAWALDRVAEAHERGLTAALVGGRVADAAAAGGRPPPPIRLLPPAGLAPFVASLLLAVGATSIPAPAAASDKRTAGAVAAPGEAGGDAEAPVAAARIDARADDDARRARAERAVREALGLSREGALDPQEVARSLADPAALAAARKAAEPGSPAATALDAVRPPDRTERPDRIAAAVADALSSDAALRAEALRRDAAARRAAGRSAGGMGGVGGRPVVPVARRDLVMRYLTARLEAAADAPRVAPSAPGPR